MDIDSVEYEKLTKEIYEALNNAEGVKTVDVKHNVKVQGRSGCKHQIDVYWEFEMMGETHRVAIECKNYTSDVSIGKVRDFFGVLHDIGDIKEIFVTRVGYQSGAVTFADYYKISLKEMRFPNPEDWGGLVKDITLRSTIVMPRVLKMTPNFDMEWLLSEGGFREGDAISVVGMSDEVKIVSASSEQITTLLDMENGLPHEWQASAEKSHSYKFDDAYVLSSDGKRLKIKSVDYLYEVSAETEETSIEGEKIAKAILKDVKTGKIKFYNKDGAIK